METEQVFMAAAVAISLIVFSVAYGISKISAKASESIARQPEAAQDIKNNMFLPCSYIEGAGVIGIVLCFVIAFFAR